MNIFFYIWVNHLNWFHTIRTWQIGCGAEKAAYQRALPINLTAIFAKIWATVFFQCRLMFSIGFNWQSREFFGSCRYWATTVVAARNTFKGRDTRPKKTNYLAFFSQLSAFLISNLTILVDSITIKI